jgi:hypothetical protein
MVGDNGPPAFDGFGGNRAFLGAQADAYKLIGQLAIRVFSDEFIAGVATPKVDPGAMEKFAGGGTKEPNQRCWIGSLSRFRGDAKEKLLKQIVEVGPRRPIWQRFRIAGVEYQSFPVPRFWFRTILTSD